MRRPLVDAPGFTLIETVIGVTMSVVAVFGLLQLFVLSSRALAAARSASVASVLAAEKMEQLRGLTWGFDASGLPSSDTSSDIAVSPERPSGGSGLNPSPSNALLANTSGFCDFLDNRGRSLGTGTDPPASAVYIRRWSISSLPDAADVLVLQVRVLTRAASAGGPIGAGRSAGEARLLSVKARKAG